MILKWSQFYALQEMSPWFPVVYYRIFNIITVNQSCPCSPVVISLGHHVQ